MSDMYRRQPYDGQLSDDEPQKVVVMSEGWWAFVRGAFERLASEAAWDADSDAYAAASQALDVLVRLLGASVTDLIAYSKQVTIDGLALHSLCATPLSVVIDTAQVHNYNLSSSPGILNENVFDFEVCLPSGFVNLYWLTKKGTYAGKFRWALDGVELDSEYDVDLYAASAVNNLLVGRSFEIVVPGKHVFLLKNVGKNAASAGYNCNVTSVVIQ